MDSKDTLFGKVPNDWSVKSIGSIFTLSQGLQISKNLRSNTQKENYVPLLKITDLPKKVFSEYVTNIDKQYLASKNNIIYTRTGNVGLVYTDIEGCVHNNCFQIHIDNEFFDKYYVYYYLKSPQVFEYSNQVASGSVQKDLTHPSFKSCIFGYPNKKEQQKIASILSSLDDKIELNTAMNQTLEAMAQTIFKSWFVDFEPFKEGEFIESELGMIPEGWEVKKLKELTDTITKGTTPTTMRAKFTSQGINFVKAESITNTHTFETSKFMYIDNVTHEKLKRSQLQNKDLLYTIAGTIGRYALVDNSILPANTNQAIAIIRPKQDMLHSEYLLCYFESIFYKTYLQSRVVQAVQANLSLGEISNSPILLPKKKVLELFHSKVEPLFRQIQQNQQQNQTLTTLRDTLLPKLMSGEVKV